MLQKSGRLVLWEAMFILELHSAETQDFYSYYSICYFFNLIPYKKNIIRKMAVPISLQHIFIMVLIQFY